MVVVVFTTSKAAPEERKSLVIRKHFCVIQKNKKEKRKVS